MRGCGSAVGSDRFAEDMCHKLHCCCRQVTETPEARCFAEKSIRSSLTLLSEDVSGQKRPDDRHKLYAFGDIAGPNIDPGRGHTATLAL